ncbi:MAG: prepilin-type N-terminal cleavage/methylation domain-containing protein, partial [Candidatus Brocadiales bacterium]|nr:prepilin-type N-terminal cleavage/methylation domain-containing protein [Candidatus Brocadiales bacterium]
MKKQLSIFNRNSWQLKKLPKEIYRIVNNRKSKIVNLKSQSAFTLMELLVVIGII